MDFESKNFSKAIIDLLLKLGFIFVLGVAALNIISPFITLIIWSFIITISLVPLHNKLSGWLGGRRKIAATLITVFFLALIIGPFGILIETLVHNLKEVSQNIHPDQLKQLEPSESIKKWPFIGDRLYDLAHELTADRETFVEKHQEKLMVIGQWLIQVMTNAGKAVLIFFGAMIISGLLLVFTDQRQSLGLRIGKRIAGAEGGNLASLIEKTIRSVVSGVLGVAIIQAILAGIGFFVMDIPFAGVWTVLALFLAMVQIGVGPVAIGAVVYGFAYHDTTPAVIFLIWNIVVMVSDNILKPMLMGRGLEIPMVVIFIGAIGGMIHNGILGLFLGPVILALVYRIVDSWLNQDGSSVIDFKEEPTTTE